MRRRALATLLAPLLLLPLLPAEAQEAPATPASFLVYRPWPDAGGDPLATPLAPPPFDAPRLPATRVDRSASASPAPENAPERAPAHFREMQRLLGAAAAEGAPLALAARGIPAPGLLTVVVDARPLTADAPPNATLEVVVFEHGVEVEGRAHPYVARFATAPAELRVPGNASIGIRLDPAWSLDRMGVVAIARDEARVLQSVTWLVRSDAPAESVAKTPLLEHVSATWCAPCIPADEAFALLSTQRGAAGPLPSGAPAPYLRPPTLALGAGLALGALAAIVLTRRGGGA